jgi:hypothetical protein
MTLRGLLQHELWSKQTSRTVLARTLRVLKWAGIVIGILVAAIGIAVTAELRWLTSGERSSAKEALSSMDSLQDFGAVTDSDFDAGLAQARVKVDRAQESAWTLRDYAVASSLFDYWVETKASRNEKQEMERARRDLSPSELGPRSFLRRDPNQAGADLRGAIRSTLHQQLD